MVSERKYPKRRAVLMVAAAPWNLLVVWLAVALIRLFWGKKMWWSEWSLWTELRPDSWPSRSWYRRKIDGQYVENPEKLHATRGKWRTWGGTTLGHGGFYGPGVPDGPDMNTVCEFHEHVHVEQYEVFSLLGFTLALLVGGFLAAVGSWEWGLVAGGALWFLGGYLGFQSGWLTALLRGEEAYRGSAHEEHAYATAHDLLADFMKQKHGGS